MKPIIALITVLFSILPCGVAAEERPQKRAGFAYPPTMEGAKVETYKKVGDTELKVWVFPPKDVAGPRPAIVFFFGGGTGVTEEPGSGDKKEMNQPAMSSMFSIPTPAYRFPDNLQTKPDGANDEVARVRPAPLACRSLRVISELPDD